MRETLSKLVFMTFLMVPAYAPCASSDPAVIEAAKKEGRLVRYTTLQADEDLQLSRAFEKLYPFIKTELLPIKGGIALINRLVTEARANVHNADTVALADSQFITLKKRDMLLPYISAASQSIPEGFKDPQGYWTGIYRQIMVVAYNTRLVAPAEVPKKYHDLLHPRWKGKISLDTEDEEWFFALLQIMGEKEGRDFAQKLSLQSPQYRRGHTLQTLLLGAGEFHIVGNTYNHTVADFKRKGSPVDWIAMQPAPARSIGLGIYAGSKNPNAAKLFIDFVASKEGQMLLRDGFKRVPIRSDVEADPPSLTKGIQIYPIPADKLGEQQESMAREYQDIFLRQRFLETELAK